MIPVKQIRPECLYAIQGKVTAGSVFIEDLSEAKKFISLLNVKLDGFLKIHDYMLSKSGWIILAEIGSEQSIFERYLNMRKHSKKANPKNILTEVWRIISEQFRHILSTFIKYTNWKQGRTGSKVHNSYERYYFESVEEGFSFMRKMKAQEHELSQKNKRYRAAKGLYRISQKIGLGHIYLCTKNVMSATDLGVEYKGAIAFMSRSASHVLRQLIITTQNTHFNKKNQQNSPLNENPKPKRE